MLCKDRRLTMQLSILYPSFPSQSPAVEDLGCIASEEDRHILADILADTLEVVRIVLDHNCEE